MTDDRITVHAGDCLEVLRTMADNSIDSVVTDPPYHLTSIVKRFGSPTAAPAKVGATGAYARASAGFMGKKWDGGDIAFRPELWAEVLRVLKPGGHMLAFGGSRTYHRLACAVEDAGFEIRDQIMWVFATGFPKSHDVSKGIDRTAGAEREKIRHLPRPETSGTMACSSDSRPWIEASRVKGYHEVDGNEPITPEAIRWEGWGTALKPAHEPIVLARKPLSEATVAANVLRWGTGAINVDGCRVASDDDPDTMEKLVNIARDIHAFSDRDDVTLTVRQVGAPPQGRWPANLIHDGSDEVLAAFPETTSGAFQRSETAPAKVGKNGIYGRFNGAPDGKDFGPANSGSAARFFYCAKASKKDRMGSKHPTVKPVKLIQYLVRLITPPGGTVLDCFAGTGTTGQAAITEGCRAILIEREEEYLADIDRRFAPTELRL